MPRPPTPEQAGRGQGVEVGQGLAGMTASPAPPVPGHPHHLLLDTYPLGGGGLVPTPPGPSAYPPSQAPVTSGAYRAAIQAQLHLLRQQAGPMGGLGLLGRRKPASSSSLGTLGVAASVLSWTIIFVFAINVATVSRKERALEQLLERRRELAATLRALPDGP
jgi:hypothetical protein